MNFARPERDLKEIGDYITQTAKKREPMRVMKRKWVDDLSILVSVDLKKDAVESPEIMKNQPTTFHSRTGHIIPENKNKMQNHINDLVQHATTHHMRINKIKTKAAIFNPLRSIDIHPNITLDNDDEPLEVVDEVKLLGQIITTDLKTMRNTRNMCRNAYARMNILRRLSALGCPRNELLDVLRQQVLCMVEQAVPYWPPSLPRQRVTCWSAYSKPASG